MNGVFVDSCILLDLFTDDPIWADWSENILDRYSQTNTLYINSIVYTEVSIGFNKIEEVEKEIKEVDREVVGELDTRVRGVEKLTQNQRIIIDLIKKDPTISKKEMSKIIGIRPSSIDKNIATLKQKVYLKRVGPAKGGHWEINKNHKFRKTQHQIIIAKSYFHPTLLTFLSSSYLLHKRIHHQGERTWILKTHS